MKGFVFICSVGAGEDGHLGIHGLAVFGRFFDFPRDFLIVFAVEEGFDDDGEAGDDEEDGEDDLPGDAIGKDVLGGEEQDDTGC